jgi:uncharacterized protein
MSSVQIDLEDPRLQEIVKKHPFSLLFTTLSGAHLYGFPSPDSDYDLRGVHILPLHDIVSLDVGQETLNDLLLHIRLKNPTDQDNASKDTL